MKGIAAFCAPPSMTAPDPVATTAVIQHYAGTFVDHAVTISDANVATMYEPVMPSTVTLVGMAAVLVTCAVAGVVWNNQVVPVSRTKLALSKSRGEVKEYLDEIRDADERGLERWLLSDWLQKGNTKKEPALPILKDAKWNSGDNPVVVTAALMVIGIILASVTERIMT